MTEKEPFVPIGDVAEHFCVSVSTIRAWLRSGRIPEGTYIKLGTTYRFKVSAVTDALMQADVPDEPEEDQDDPQMEMDFGEGEEAETKVEAESETKENGPIALFDS